MDGSQIVIWILVGLAAGVLASFVVPNGFGILGDICVGMAGAFVGGWVFGALHWHAPFTGIAGVIVVAFIGACILLLVLRLIRRTTGGSSWRTK